MSLDCFGEFLDQITNYDRGKKCTVVWPSVGVFGGSMSSDCFGGLIDQITTKKKGTVVWPSVGMFRRFHELELLIKLRLKKKVQSSGRWLEYLGGSMSLDC
jgi:hypothetical protein